MYKTKGQLREELRGELGEHEERPSWTTYVPAADAKVNQVDYFIKRRQLQKRQDAMYARDAGNLATQTASVPNNGRP